LVVNSNNLVALLTLLHVLLEGRSGGDGLPGVSILLGLGVPGVSHTSGSLLGLLAVEGKSTAESLGGGGSRGESGGASDEKSENSSELWGGRGGDSLQG